MVEGVGKAMAIKKMVKVGVMDGVDGGLTQAPLWHVIFQPREDHMTPRAVFFFRFLLLSASAPSGALHTHLLVIPTLRYSYGPIYEMDGKIGGRGPTVQQPRVGLHDYRNMGI